MLAPSAEGRAMNHADRVHLLGTYRTPRFRYGQTVRCEVRGDVTVVGLSDGLIPWPIGKRGRAMALVVFQGLARAVRRESNLAVCHWWGITPQTVTKWRKMLGVGSLTPGTRQRLRDNYFHDGRDAVMQERARERLRDPEVLTRREATRKGKPLPRHVTEAAAAARRGTHHSAEARPRMSEAHKRRGSLVPGIRTWTPAEDDQVRALSLEEAARRTGRSLKAVYKRRLVLRLPDGRAEGQARRRAQERK
jgi:hypothetical protein